MNKTLFAAVPLGALLLLGTQPSWAACTATADLRTFGTFGASADTIRVTHQAILGPAVTDNVTFRVVNPAGDILGEFSITLEVNASVNYSIGQIYGMAHVSPPWVYAPNLVQVVENDAPPPTGPHDMQSVYTNSSNRLRTPLTFTCDERET